MLMTHVHISYGVSKLGADIPSVSLPVGCTCRPDAPCFRKCYGRRGRFAISRTKALIQNNLELWCCEPEQYERDVAIAAFRSRFFRWHCTGDIPDAKYLEMMIRVARNLESTRFLCFTKKFELVNQRIDTFGALPANLNMVFSAWGAFLPDNPHALPVAYIRFRNQPADIPDNAYHCPKYCGNCVMSGESCWDLKLGEAVCFDEH